MKWTRLTLVLALLSWAAVNAEDLQSWATIGWPDEYMTLSSLEQLSCRLANLDSVYSAQFVAISFRDHPNACGLCLNITCAEPKACKSPKLSGITAAIVEDCQDCQPNELRLNSFAFRALTGKASSAQARAAIKFEFTDCQPTDDHATSKWTSIGTGLTAVSSLYDEEMLSVVSPREEKAEYSDAAVVVVTEAGPTAETIEPITLISSPTVEQQTEQSTESTTAVSFKMSGTGTLGSWSTDDAKFNRMGCGFTTLGLSPHFQTHYVALNQDAWNMDQPACGSCISITCDSCSNVVAQVVDTCGSCSSLGDLLLSADTIKDLVAGTNSNNTKDTTTIKLSYSIVSCQPYTEGDVYLNILPGSNDWYAGIALSNAAEAIRSVRINGQDLDTSSSVGYTWSSRGGSKLDITVPMREIELTSVTGEKVSTSIGAFKSGSLGVQFSSSSSYD